MDRSITLITPELMEQLGAAAYDLGMGVDDHNMNPGARAIEDWQRGWRQRNWDVRQRDFTPAAGEG